MNQTDAERRLLRNSIITILLGSALVWLPLVNTLADQPATNSPTAFPLQLLLTCILANVGIAILILINVRVNLRRLRQASAPRQEPPADSAP